jgi:hypothetical protein
MTTMQPQHLRDFVPHREPWVTRPERLTGGAGDFETTEPIVLPAKDER